MPSQIKNFYTIEEIKKNLSEYFYDKPVRKAYIFGSYARGEANELSDMDILVELDFTEPIGLYFFTMEYELKKIFKQKIDLITIEEISPFIKPYIDKDKILVYERKE